MMRKIIKNKKYR